MILNVDSNLLALRAAMQKALDEHAIANPKLGVKFKVGRCKYDAAGNWAKFDVEAFQVGENGAEKTKAATDFELYATSYGLKKEDLGRKFVNLDGQAYVIIGLNARKRRYPIMTKRVGDGRTFNFPSESVTRLLKTK